MPIEIMAATQEKIDTLVKGLPADFEVIDDGQQTYHSDHLGGRLSGYRERRVG